MQLFAGSKTAILAFQSS